MNWAKTYTLTAQLDFCIYYAAKAYSLDSCIFRQTMKQCTRSQYAPLLTRIGFQIRSSELEGQILTKNHKNQQIHVECVQGRNFSQKQKPAGAIRNVAKSL